MNQKSKLKQAQKKKTGTIGADFDEKIFIKSVTLERLAQEAGIKVTEPEGVPDEVSISDLKLEINRAISTKLHKLNNEIEKFEGVIEHVASSIKRLVKDNFFIRKRGELSLNPKFEENDLYRWDKESNYWVGRASIEKKDLLTLADLTKDIQPVQEVLSKVTETSPKPSPA